MKGDKIPTNSHYVNMTKVSNIQEGFLRSVAKTQLWRKSLRAGKGKSNTSFWKEQCCLANVEIVRRAMFLFKKYCFGFFFQWRKRKTKEKKWDKEGRLRLPASFSGAGRADPLPHENHCQNQATQNILAASLEQCQAVFYFVLDSLNWDSVGLSLWCT